MERDGAEQRQRAARHREAKAEDDQALKLMSGGPIPAHAEGESTIRRGIGDRGEQQRGEVGGLRAQRMAKQQKQQQIRERAPDADRREPQDLPGQAGRDPVDGDGMPAQLLPQVA